MSKGHTLQDPYLNALRKERVPVSIYLVNGIKLQGQIESFDQFVVKDGDVEKIKVNPIFFESFKYAITPQAEVELKKIILAMNSFPKIRIRIESHTDSRGPDLMNYKLSNQRARSTYDYLIANGIDPSRIESAIGYGETELRNYCINGVKCTEDEHLINRRSDFIIVSK